MARAALDGGRFGVATQDLIRRGTYALLGKNISPRFARA
jgi:hypothetical protein